MNDFAFETYTDRRIDFVKTKTIAGWAVKFYTLTNNDIFESEQTLQAVIKTTENWVKKAKQSKIPTHKNAFVIVHEAREGVLTLFNWWTGGEMLETDVYFSSFEEPTKVVQSPYDTSALVCVWELQIFAHERQAWINHVLKKAQKPDFITYSKDYFNSK